MELSCLTAKTVMSLMFAVDAALPLYLIFSTT